MSNAAIVEKGAKASEFGLPRYRVGARIHLVEAKEATNAGYGVGCKFSDDELSNEFRRIAHLAN